MTAYAKALTAAAIAALTALATGLTPDPDGTVALSAAEWITAAIAALTALSAVWAVPNKPAPAPAAPTHEPQHKLGV